MPPIVVAHGLQPNFSFHRSKLGLFKTCPRFSSRASTSHNSESLEQEISPRRSAQLRFSRAALAPFLEGVFPRIRPTPKLQIFAGVYSYPTSQFMKCNHSRYTSSQKKWESLGSSPIPRFWLGTLVTLVWNPSNRLKV